MKKILYKQLKNYIQFLNWIKMEVRPHRIINRKKTKLIKVGKVDVGGNSKISVQSMTNTLTTDIKGTIDQILSLYHSILTLLDQHGYLHLHQY